MTAGYPFQLRDEFQRLDEYLGASQAVYSDACWGVRSMADCLMAATTVG